MTRNVGVLAGILRLMISAGSIWLFFSGERRVWEFAVLTVAAVLPLAAIAGCCPAYALFGGGHRDRTKTRGLRSDLAGNRHPDGQNDRDRGQCDHDDVTERVRFAHRWLRGAWT